MAASPRDWSDLEVYHLLNSRYNLALAIARRAGQADPEEAVDGAVVQTVIHARHNRFLDRAEGEVWAYFRMVLRTECRNLRTQTTLVGGRPIDEVGDCASPTDTTDLVDQVADEESLRRLMQAIEALDDELRSVMHGRIKGLTLQEIAEGEGSNLAAVHRREKRAYAILREHLGHPQFPDD